MDLGVCLGLLQKQPLFFDDALREARNRQRVLPEEFIRDEVLVPQLHAELGAVLVGNGELEDLVPDRVCVVVLDGGLVRLALEFDNAVGVWLADPLGVGKVARGANSNVKAAHVIFAFGPFF